MFTVPMNATVHGPRPLRYIHSGSRTRSGCLPGSNRWAKCIYIVVPSIRNRFNMMHRDPIPSSRSVHVRFSKSFVPLTLICTRTHTSPRVQRRTCTGGSRLPLGSRSAIVLLSVAFSMQRRSMECRYQSSHLLLSSFGIFCCMLV